MDIRFFKLTETDILQKGINDIWAQNHIFAREKKLLKYMYYDNPSRHLLTNSNFYSFLGAWEDEKLIGLLGVLPFVLNIQGKKDIGYCLTNWIVVPECRTTGAGLALLSEVQRYNPGIILSLGINENVAKLYKTMRWNVLNDCPRWIGVIDKDKTTKLILKGDKKPLRHWNEVKPIQTNTSYVINEEFELDEKMWDTFYWNGFAKKTVGFARDYSFLKWRYLNHPLFKYKMLVCRDQIGTYKGLAIVRVEPILENEKIGRVIEFIASDQESAINLANSIIEANKDALFLDYYCFSAISSWGLESVGFKRVLKSEEEQFVVPSRFQPIDLEVTSIMASMFINKSVVKKLNLINDILWYVTKGDSDQDRPN